MGRLIHPQPHTDQPILSPPWAAPLGILGTPIGGSAREGLRSGSQSVTTVLTWASAQAVGEPGGWMASLAPGSLFVFSLLFAFMRAIGHTGGVATVDLLLHPVRLRLVQAFLGGRELTTAQLAAELADVSAVQLYRHVSLLLDAGVLHVVGERRVRGAVERTFALRLERTRIEPDDLARLSRDEHLQAFATFSAGLLAAYERYLNSGEPDLVRDGVSYSMNALWLSDQEYADLLADVARIIVPRAAFRPGPGRRRRLAASAFIPVPEQTEGDADDDGDRDR
jgi:DNA-binding transcriptional ArsR family regulator